MADLSYVMAANGPSGRLARAVGDLRSALRLWPLWTMLAWVDVKQRYRRAVIGPFWISLSMGVMVLGMGAVYGTLLHQDKDSFIPFLASGFLAWFYISTSIGESASTFILAEGLLKQGGLPVSLHVFRTVWRNLIILGHNAIVMLGVYLWSGDAPWSTLPLVVPGLVLVTVNLVWIALVIGPLCARFRDLPPIVNTALQMFFFITPIVFRPDSLQRLTWLAWFNPFYYLVQAIRGPLVGQGLSAGIALKLALMGIVGWALGLAFFARFRGRIAFWV